MDPGEHASDQFSMDYTDDSSEATQANQAQVLESLAPSECLWLNMLSFNLEGLNRNASYLHSLISQFKPMIIFLQETWLPFSEKYILDTFHPDYSFSLSSPDMHRQPEDLILHQSHIWHGVVVGWHKDLDAHTEAAIGAFERIAGIKMKIKMKAFSTSHIMHLLQAMTTIFWNHYPA